MYLQEILEVGIGLVFMWLVISIAAMQLQEWIANLLKWRSSDLEQAVRKILADKDLATQFYDHQLIRGLSRDLQWNERLWQKIVNFFRTRAGKAEIVFEHRPSYIPSNDFALTLFDLVMKAGTDALPVKAAFTNFHEALESLKTDAINLKDKNELKEALEFLAEEARAVATSDIGKDSIDAIKSKIRTLVKDKSLKGDVDVLIESLDQYYQRLLAEYEDPATRHNDRSLQRLRYGLVAIGMNNPKLEQSLRTLLIGVEERATETERAFHLARSNMETWFNNAMSRLSGWYKRKSQLMAFIIGLVLALLLNVDSINLATSLWREPTLRQALVENADKFIQENPELPASDSTASANSIVTQFQDQLQALRIPFGWETESYPLQAGETCQIIPVSANAVWGMWSEDTCKKVTNAPLDSTGWLSKITGILLTAMAAAQGAPFWFDILKKLVNVRSSGPNPSEQKPAG